MCSGGISVLNTKFLELQPTTSGGGGKHLQHPWAPCFLPQGPGPPVSWHCEQNYLHPGGRFRVIRAAPTQVCTTPTPARASSKVRLPPLIRALSPFSVVPVILGCRLLPPGLPSHTPRHRHSQSPSFRPTPSILTLDRVSMTLSSSLFPFLKGVCLVESCLEATSLAGLCPTPTPARLSLPWTAGHLLQCLQSLGCGV